MCFVFPTRTVIALSALSMLAAAPASGQRLETRFQSEPAPENPVVEVAKWTLGGLAAAAGVYAFVLQADAEERYDALERLCTNSPALCRPLTADGAYADPVLERRYQDIRGDYRDSRLLLLGAHVLAVGSAVLFILDLPRDQTPDNVEYEPPALRVGVRPDGALQATLRYPVSNILTRSP